MTREEKLLYHQIHPLKLLTDWTAGFAALPLLWRHRLRAALLVTFVPPILVSVLIIRYVDLEPYKRSASAPGIEGCGRCLSACSSSSLAGSGG